MGLSESSAVVQRLRSLTGELGNMELPTQAESG